MLDMLAVAIGPFAGAVVVAVTGVCVAIRQLQHQRRLTAQRATLEFISETEINNRDWIELRSLFADMRKKHRLMDLTTALAKHLEDGAEFPGKQRKKLIEVTTFLNHYELAASGVNHDIIDEELYSEWTRSSLIRVWKDAEAFVVELRRVRGSPKAYCQLEELADSWHRQDQDRGGRTSD